MWSCLWLVALLPVLSVPWLCFCEVKSTRVRNCVDNVVMSKYLHS